MTNDQLAWKLAGYAAHQHGCGLTVDVAGEEGTAMIVTPCTCGLTELIDDAMSRADFWSSANPEAKP